MIHSITRIHEKILDHIIKRRKSDPDLYFIPRQKNNKKRLDQGYWFIGNENYLNVSFWYGRDWKEKIHIIGFVVTEKKECYIELSTQGNPSLAPFLLSITEKVNGFWKDGSKNKWFKKLTDSNYISNLNYFIDTFKPIVDNLLIISKPRGIVSMDLPLFKKFGERVLHLRKSQILFGETNKITRITWNTERWQYPSGTLGKSTSQGTHEGIYGYGHEEWLFDRSRLVNGYHYGFIEALNIKTDLHVGNIYKIKLFTINNQDKVYYAGQINKAECISSTESVEVYNYYKSHGWLDQMTKSLEKVGADISNFKKTPSTIFFNVKFKIYDILEPDDLEEISKDDVNITTDRFKLLPQKSGLLITEDDQPNDEVEDGKQKNTNKRKRVYNCEQEYDPYHDIMQNAIVKYLKASMEYNSKTVRMEKSWVDIRAITKEGSQHFFEIKTDTPKRCIRNAIGQIMEYTYFPTRELAKLLIIVGDSPPDNDTISYINHIRDLFEIPFCYCYFNWETHSLSEKY